METTAEMIAPIRRRIEAIIPAHGLPLVTRALAKLYTSIVPGMNYSMVRCARLDAMDEAIRADAMGCPGLSDEWLGIAYALDEISADLDG